MGEVNILILDHVLAAAIILVNTIIIIDQFESTEEYQHLKFNLEQHAWNINKQVDQIMV